MALRLIQLGGDGGYAACQSFAECGNRCADGNTDDGRDVELHDPGYGQRRGDSDEGVQPNDQPGGIDDHDRVTTSCGHGGHCVQSDVCSDRWHPTLYELGSDSGYAACQSFAECGNRCADRNTDNGRDVELHDSGYGQRRGDSDEGVRATINAPVETTAIPTMNEWGMIILTMLLGIVSIYYLRRRKLTV